jgi:hypothetical protein
MDINWLEAKEIKIMSSNTLSKIVVGDVNASLTRIIFFRVAIKLKPQII